MFKKRVLAVFVILQMAVSIMFPAPAHAATYQPNVHEFWGVSDFWAVNGVSNRFDAALGLIGEWGKKIQISNANYAALSNSGSGGAFYELAQLLQNAPGQWEPGPDLGMNPIATIAWAGLYTDTQINYGDPTTWLWYCFASDANIADARRDFLKVLNGESLGGGGSGGGGIGNLQFSFTTVGTYWGNFPYYCLYGNDKWWCNNSTAPESKYSIPSSPITLSFAGGLFDSFPSDVREYSFFAIVDNSNANFTVASQRLSMRLFAIKTLSLGKVDITYHNPGGSVMSLVANQAMSSGDVYASSGTGSVPYVFDGGNLSLSTSGAVSWNAQSIGAGTVIQQNMTSNSFNRMCFSTGSGGGGGGGDNHWPEPTTPEPDPPTTNPEPDPDPPDPPTFDPPGFDPDIPVPDVPVTIVPPDNTTAADYTPWLRAILTALNTIIDDLGEHCDHIRVAMRDYLSGFYEALSDDLESYYSDLTDYLSDLAKWIVSHLNFDVKQPDVNVNVPGYDDSSVVGWLRRIYYKLGGSGSPKPDPIEDTDGALDWWAKFLEWITNALGGLLTDFVGDLGEFLQELIDTFPFSIPWDIVAMLTLLDAQRATPDFTVTIPAQDGWWDDITVRIELSAYNDAMATVRGMVMIWWMYILVMKTDWMMLLFDGANNAISDFVSRLTGKG